MIITFARQGQEIGQFAEDEVPALVASGQILPSDDYWHEGLDDWRKVGDRWPVAKVAHYPTTPVMTMEEVATSPRSGFALIFSEEITEPTTFDYIMTKGLGSPRADLIAVPEEASDHRPVALEISLSGP